MKGQKTGGRTKGTPNKTTSTLKEYITELIDVNREQLLKDIEDMEPKDRVNVLVKLMAYVMPKPTESQPTAQTPGNLEDDIVLYFGGSRYNPEK